MAIDENRPLLSLPSPVTSARENQTERDFRRFVLPSPARQRDRLAQKIEALNRAFSAQRPGLTPDGNIQDTDKILVFEVISSESVKDFYGALKKLTGLEWLADQAGEELDDSPDFGILSGEEDEISRRLDRRLYILASNRAGMNHILSFWRQYQLEGEGVFGHGYGKWKHLFSMLYDIRTWNNEDRVLGTGLAQDWQLRSSEGDPQIYVEIELWYRSDEQVRRSNALKIRELIQQIEGEFVRESTIPSIRYHGILARLPTASVQSMLAENPEIELIKAESIMFVRPNAQVFVGSSPGVGEELVGEADVATEIQHDETILVGMFDGLPLQNHFALSGRIEIDDVDGITTNVPVADRRHGTAMASLILHSDLSNENRHPLRRKLYVRPILVPSGDNQETIPERELIVDMVHRSLRRIFEGGGADFPPLNPRLKCINFSVGERYRPFISEISPLAKLFDYYSAKFGVLFVVSAGNYQSSVKFNGPSQGIEGLTSGARQAQALEYWSRENSGNRIMSPAESINSICVGATNSDGSNFIPHAGSIALLADQNIPCLYNPTGSGVGRSIKPDFFAPGGRIVHRMQSSSVDSCTFNQIIRTSVPPGLKVACPSPVRGETNRTSFVAGTSNAAAMSTHVAGRILEMLSEGLIQPNPPEEYWSVITKALLVHGSDWRDAKEALIAMAPAEIRNNLAKQKAWISRFFGHGAIDSELLFSGESFRATTIGYGKLRENEGDTFKFGLPQCLSGARTLKRLTVTLAWFSPVNVESRKYRSAKLWFSQAGREVPDPLRVGRARYDHSAVKRGTVQHEIFEGTDLSTFSAREDIEIKVNCKRETGKPFSSPIRYALVVTLEDAHKAVNRVYDEVRARIEIENQVRARARALAR